MARPLENTDDISPMFSGDELGTVPVNTKLAPREHSSDARPPTELLQVPTDRPSGSKRLWSPERPQDEELSATVKKSRNERPGADQDSTTATTFETLLPFPPEDVAKKGCIYSDFLQNQSEVVRTLAEELAIDSVEWTEADQKVFDAHSSSKTGEATLWRATYGIYRQTPYDLFRYGLAWATEEGNSSRSEHPYMGRKLIQALADLLPHPIWQRRLDFVRYALQMAVYLRVEDHVIPLGPPSTAPGSFDSPDDVALVSLRSYFAHGAPAEPAMKALVNMMEQHRNRLPSRRPGDLKIKPTATDQRSFGLRAKDVTFVSEMVDELVKSAGCPDAVKDVSVRAAVDAWTDFIKQLGKTNVPPKSFVGWKLACEKAKRLENNIRETITTADGLGLTEFVFDIPSQDPRPEYASESLSQRTIDRFNDFGVNKGALAVVRGMAGQKFASRGGGEDVLSTSGAQGASTEGTTEADRARNGAEVPSGPQDLLEQGSTVDKGKGKVPSTAIELDEDVIMDDAPISGDDEAIASAEREESVQSNAAGMEVDLARLREDILIGDLRPEFPYDYLDGGRQPRY